MSRVPGTNKHDFDYGGYKTDQDPFSLKKGDKAFSGPQIDIKSQRARVFVAGYDVTPDVVSLSITQEREGHNSCSLTLANPRNKYVVTKEDLLLYFDNRTGIEPVLKNKDTLPTYSYAQNSISFDGQGKDPVAPFKDFGHPNSDKMKNIYLHEVNNVYQKETPSNVSPETTFKEMLWKVKRHSGIFKFENDVIFDFKEPIIVFLQGRFSSYWYFGFSGFLTAYNKNFEYGGEPAIEITGSSRKYQFSLQTEVIEPALVQELRMETKNANYRTDLSLNNTLRNFITGSSLREAIINIFLKFVQDKRLGEQPIVPVNYWEKNYVTFFEETLKSDENKNNYAIRGSKFFESGFIVLRDAVKGLWDRITSHLVDPDKGGGDFEVGGKTPEVLCATEINTQNFYDSIEFEKLPVQPLDELSPVQRAAARTAAGLERASLPNPPKPRTKGSDPMNSNYSQVLGDSIFQVSTFTVKPYTTSNVSSIYDSNVVRLWESDFRFDENNCKWQSWKSVAAVGVHPAVTEDFINKFHILPKIYGIVLDHSIPKTKQIQVTEEVTTNQGGPVDVKIELNLNKAATEYLQGMSHLNTKAQETIMKDLDDIGKSIYDQIDSLQSFKISIVAHDDIARWRPRGFLKSDPKRSLTKDLAYEKRWFGKYNNTGEANTSLIPKTMKKQFDAFTALDEYDGDKNPQNPHKLAKNHAYLSDENAEADKLLSFTRAHSVAEFMARVIQVVDAVDDKGREIPKDKLDPTGKFLKNWNALDTTPNKTTKDIYRDDGSRLGSLKGNKKVISKLSNLVKLKVDKPQVWAKLKEAIGYEINDKEYSLEVSNSQILLDGKGWSEPAYTITDPFKDLQKAVQKLANLINRSTGGYLVLDGKSVTDAPEVTTKISPKISKFKTEDELKAALKKAKISQNRISGSSKEKGSKKPYNTIASEDISHVISVLAGDPPDKIRFGLQAGDYRNKIIAILASDLTKQGRNNNRRYQVTFEPVGAISKKNVKPTVEKIPKLVDKVVVCIEQADRSPYDKLKEQVFGVPTEANYKVTGFNLHRPKFILMLPPLYMSDSHPLTAQMRQFRTFDNEYSSVETLLESLKEHMQFNYYETPIGDVIFEPYNYDMNPSQQVSAYLNQAAGEITDAEEHEIEGESFFAVPEGDPDDPESQQLPYLPIRPTYISMKFAPKKLKMNRLPIVAPKRYFRHPYYFSDLDEKTISYHFDSSNIFSQIIVTGNTVGGLPGSFNPLADKGKLDNTRLYGRLQGIGVRKDLLSGGIPIGIYVADGFEEAVVELEQNSEVSKKTADLQAKSLSLFKAVLSGKQDKFNSVLEDIGVKSAKTGSTIQEFISNNLVSLAQIEIGEINTQIRKDNAGKAEADKKKELSAIPAKVNNDADFEKILAFLHGGTKYIQTRISDFPSETKKNKVNTVSDSSNTTYLREFPMYSVEASSDKLDSRLQQVELYLRDKNIYPTTSDANEQQAESDDAGIRDKKRREVVKTYEQKFQNLLLSYCQYMVHRSDYGQKLNKEIDKKIGELTEKRKKGLKEKKIFTPEDYANQRKEGNYNPMADLVSLYGIKAAPPVHVNYLKTSLDCTIYAISLFNQYYNNAYRYEYSSIQMTPEWLVNRTGYFEYENFIALLDHITHSWSPNGTPSSSVSTNYQRRNILHYKNGVVTIDPKLTGAVGGDQNYIRDVTLDDVNNYTKKFSAYRRLGALHDSLIESLEEDGTESAADLLAARLKLIPKLRAIINQLSDQYKQWLSTAQSEIDTKYNVYISDLKATLKNITRINGAILLLGLEIESDENIIKFYEQDIKNMEAELQILNNTIVSLQQENQALASEKETLTTELNSKKDSKAPEDIARVEQINTRLKSINAITNTNNVLINETIPEKQNQTRIDQAKAADAKNLLEKKIVSKKDSIDPKVQANSLAALKSELTKAEAKKVEIETKIEVFLKSFNDSVGKHMGVVYSSQDRSSAGISYFNAMKSRDIKDPFDVSFIVTFNANHYGNKSQRGGTTAVNYSDFFVPIYQTSVEKKKFGLKEGEFYLSSKIPNSVNEDKGLVVENISESLRTHFDAFVEVTLQSNFKTVPPLVVAIKALQNKIQSILDKEKQAGST